MAYNYQPSSEEIFITFHLDLSSWDVGQLTSISSAEIEVEEVLAEILLSMDDSRDISGLLLTDTEVKRGKAVESGVDIGYRS